MAGTATGMAAINAAKTRCCRGHEFDHVNTRYWTDAAGYTRRACRACHREYQRRRKLARQNANQVAEGRRPETGGCRK